LSRDQRSDHVTVLETREAWLLKACDHLRPIVLNAGAECPPVAVSMGFPKSRRGVSTTIGECWDGQAAADGRPAIFISPVLNEPARILDVLLHELVHAAVGCEWGHRGKFVTVARTCGLVGRPTATSAGPQLAPRLYAVAQALGPLPHAHLTVVQVPKQSTRLRLWECECPVKVRVASDHFDATCNRCGFQFVRRA
jgi:hypothetical protein